MTVHRVYVTTDARARSRQVRADVWTAVRVAGLVVASLLLAPLELVTALAGLPPASWTASRIAAKARADWQARTGHETGGAAADLQTDDNADDLPELTGVVIPKESARG